MADLSIETAQGMLAGTPPTISELRGELAEHHAEHPQRAMLADLAMREIETGLERLRALGHSFRLVRGETVLPDEFPKMLYQDSPRGLVHQIVYSAAEEKEALAEGWQGHPQGKGPGAAPAGDPAPATQDIPAKAPESQAPSEPTP